jgi:Putative lumazine-binding
MSSSEEQVRYAAKNILEKETVFSCRDEDGDETQDDLPSAIAAWSHPLVSVCCVSSSHPNSFVSNVGSFSPLRSLCRNFSNSCSVTKKSNETPMVEILSVRCLDVGRRDSAAAQVRLCGGHIDGWMVFLCCRLGKNDEEDGMCCRSWRCISAAFSFASSGTILPTPQWGSVISMVWDGYCAANRACDGAKMLREAFHSTCRLTYCDGAQEGTVQIKDANEFATRVTTRYEGGMHAPFQHLKDDPRVSAEDSLIAVDFCAPDCCMVVLKVGHPPCLWTDLLTCMYIDGTWWIVHKSSCHEKFLTDLAN